MLHPYSHILNEAERRALLADIARVGLAIGRELYPEVGFNDLDIGEGTGDNETCPRERLAFLRASWGRFAPALRILEASPPTGLRWETRSVVAERARRVTPKAVLTAIRTEGVFPPRRLTERFAAPDADTPDNRFIKAVLVRFVRDLADIAALADVCAAPEIVADALRLRHRFRVALRRDPWRGVTLVPNTTLPPALLRSGPHRVFHDALRRYRNGFAFDWRSPIFTLPARETWRIYEIWCLFQTADALCSLGYRATGADCFAVSRAGLTLTLATGRGAILTFTDATGRRAHLTYRRTFGFAPDGWRSASHAMEPDITLESGNRLLILDAKWKTYTEPTESLPDEEPRNTPLTDDLNQMHAYRDGIRRGETRAVTAAWLLYPGRRDCPNREIIAFPASSPEKPFGGGQIGAVLLRSSTTCGNGCERLAQLIREVFKEQKL